MEEKYPIVSEIIHIYLSPKKEIILSKLGYVWALCEESWSWKKFRKDKWMTETGSCWNKQGKGSVNKVSKMLRHHNVDNKTILKVRRLLNGN